MKFLKSEGNVLSIGNLLWKIVRFVIIFGLAFMIIKPFIQKILLAFMSPEDLLNSTVRLVPLNWSSYYWRVALQGLDLSKTLYTTVLMVTTVAVIQSIIPSVIGYGLARFKFKGRSFAFILVIVIMLVPPQTYRIAQYLSFRSFLGTNINLIDTMIPLFILAFSGLGLKQGLYIYLMMTFFRGLPKDLENAAYIDGASPVKTFISVILPNARSMIVTIFLFSFSWQWTDVSYAGLYFSQVQVMATKIQEIYVRVGLSHDPFGSSIAQNAACIIVLIPLIILFLFAQNMLISSIVHTGQAN